MKYAYAWTNTTGIPGFYDWIMLGNGLWDPDTAVGGNSAFGLAELMNVWTKTKVLASTCQLEITNLDSSHPVHVAIVPWGYSGAFAAANQEGILVNPKAKSTTATVYDGTVRLSNSATTSTIKAVKDLGDIGFEGTSAADPTHKWYWHVVSWNDAGVAANVEFVLKIQYDTILFEPYAFTV
jgi:hypothetical protein